MRRRAHQHKQSQRKYIGASGHDGLLTGYWQCSCWTHAQLCMYSVPTVFNLCAHKGKEGEIRLLAGVARPGWCVPAKAHSADVMQQHMYVSVAAVPLCVFAAGMVAWPS